MSTCFLPDNDTKSDTILQLTLPRIRAMLIQPFAGNIKRKKMIMALYVRVTPVPFIHHLGQNQDFIFSQTK